VRTAIDINSGQFDIAVENCLFALIKYILQNMDIFEHIKIDMFKNGVFKKHQDQIHLHLYHLNL